MSATHQNTPGDAEKPKLNSAGVTVSLAGRWVPATEARSQGHARAPHSDEPGAAAGPAAEPRPAPNKH